MHTRDAEFEARKWRKVYLISFDMVIKIEVVKFECITEHSNISYYCWGPVPLTNEHKAYAKRTQPTTKVSGLVPSVFIRRSKNRQNCRKYAKTKLKKRTDKGSLYRDETDEYRKLGGWKIEEDDNSEGVIGDIFKADEQRKERMLNGWSGYITYA